MYAATPRLNVLILLTARHAVRKQERSNASLHCSRSAVTVCVCVFHDSVVDGIDLVHGDDFGHCGLLVTRQQHSTAVTQQVECGSAEGWATPR